MLLSALLLTGLGFAQGAPADLSAARARMVTRDLLPRGISDPSVLQAMAEVPREHFVPPPLRLNAYDDRPLPLGPQSSISQPYIVALMTELAGVQRGEKVLEIGTGSGYQAALLHHLGARVWTIELDSGLAERASRALKAHGYDDVNVIVGDGYLGHPPAAPFDAILVTAAPPEIPRALLDQLADGGRMVVPVGEGTQRLKVIRRRGSVFEKRDSIPVRFVPMRPRE